MHTPASLHHTDQAGAALSSVRWSLSKRSPFRFRHRSTPKSLATSPLWQTLAAAQPPKKKKLYQLLLPKPILTGARFPRSPPISGERRRNTRGTSCPGRARDTRKPTRNRRKQQEKIRPHSPKLDRGWIPVSPLPCCDVRTAAGAPAGEG